MAPIDHTPHDKLAKMSERELAQEMWKAKGSLDRNQAEAEMERRRSRYMMTSAIATSVSATGAAIAAIIATYVAYRGCR
jgi:hypothetical protein